MINLLPPKYLKEENNNRNKILIWVLILSLLLVPTLYSVKLFYQNDKVEMKLKVVRSELNKLDKDISKLNKMKKEYKNLQNNLQKRTEIVGSEIDWSSVLKEVRVILPGDSWIKNFNIYNHNLFRITGYTLNRQELKTIVNKMGKSIYFNNISIDFVKRKTLNVSNYDKTQVIHYQLSGVIGNDKGDNYEVE
ncbi:PilN domain-containing protein [Selenihalanaerobacter shriftii]|uniref:Fimbrial assembly protein (PilN) n=1 Tax=Selenihalanaerobacter shriftii TaxID=142842 RepID=A0A1T4P3M2_9FIRM|nr:PilN domain-containing protein [Selenihalanaerobacter shriftii]SJZ86104.1 Fimbrial assembly protein (PilN) [Selenihalanaerobacter shriftii]